MLQLTTIFAISLGDHTPPLFKLELVTLFSFVRQILCSLSIKMSVRLQVCTWTVLEMCLYSIMFFWARFVYGGWVIITYCSGHLKDWTECQISLHCMNSLNHIWSKCSYFTFWYPVSLTYSLTLFQTHMKLYTLKRNRWYLWKLLCWINLFKTPQPWEIEFQSK